MALFLVVLVATPYSSLGQGSREAFLAEVRAVATDDAAEDRGEQSTTDLSLLFGVEAEAHGLSLLEVRAIYNQTYGEVSQQRGKTLRDFLGLKGLPWFVAILAVLAAVFRQAAEKIVMAPLVWLGKSLYGRFAATAILRRTALKRYKMSLAADLGRLKIPFRPERPLELRKVFVPVRLDGRLDDWARDGRDIIAEAHRLLVLGVPGSGKSTLLKSVVLRYADSRHRDRIVVFLNLHRLNGVGKTLLGELVKTLEDHDFPSGEKFLDRHLRSGTCHLLLDGLDEVQAEQREDVARQINDFLLRYDRCPAVVSCRSAVYDGELDERIETRADLVEFDDSEIGRFLRTWQEEMPPGKSVDQLLKTLLDRPKIKRLARNPLLLTIIAYLYTDKDGFVLPHSRAEFYQEATDELLDRLKAKRNRFNAANKRMLLEAVAFSFHSEPADSSRDPRSQGRARVLQTVAKVLPQLNLAVEFATPMLEEIVERSGLLLEFASGQRYQFGHLTLQEYFAARCLIGRPQELLDLYRKDPDGWREVVKLWCGLAGDSTALIAELFELDPAMAFECLGDARKVAPEVADKVLQRFYQQFPPGLEQQARTLEACAAVAADIRSRGREVFDFLGTQLSSTEPRAAAIAARALALTNLPEAAEKLADHVSSSPQVLESLGEMGDLAVLRLKERAAELGWEGAVVALARIGTPLAAEALVGLLHVSAVAPTAAFGLLSLFHRPEIEEHLAGCHGLLQDLPKQEEFEGILKPFGYEQGTLLDRIASVVAGFIASYRFTEEDVGGAYRKLDPRLVVPIVLHRMKGLLQRRFELDSLDSSVVSANLSVVLEEFRGKTVSYGQLLRELEDRMWKGLSPIRTGFALLGALDPNGFERLTIGFTEDQKVWLLSVIQKEAKPIEKWKQLRRKFDFDFCRSAVGYLALAAMTLILGWAVGWEVHCMTSQGVGSAVDLGLLQIAERWANWFHFGSLTVLGVTLLLLWGSFGFRQMEPSVIMPMILIGAAGPILVPIVLLALPFLWWWFRDSEGSLDALGISLAIFGILLLLALPFSLSYLWSLYGVFQWWPGLGVAPAWQWTLLAFLSAIGLVLALLWQAARLIEIKNNPYRGYWATFARVTERPGEGGESSLGEVARRAFADARSSKKRS